MVRVAIATLLSGGNSQRDMEARSEQARDPGLVVLLGLRDERVADNTFGTLLRRLDPQDLRAVLHESVKLEHRRGNLSEKVGGRRVAALDGKALAVVRWHALRNAARDILDRHNDARAHDETWSPDSEEVCRILATDGIEFVQFVNRPKGEPYGLVRMHRWTLVSACAAVTLDETPIAGASNEVGSAPASFDELMRVYSRTSLFDTVTADAGNTSLEFATKIVARGVNYVLAIKKPQGDIYAEAVRLLSHKNTRTYSCSEVRCGQTVAYEVRVAPLEGAWHKWEHAQQVIRIDRVVMGEKDTEPSEGTRYFVTSLNASQLSAQQAQEICRTHWRCENEGHWTADAIFNEDANRAPLSRHPRGMLVGSLIRILAQNILAVLRALARVVDHKKPSWRTVRHHVLCILFGAFVDAPIFDETEASA